MDTERPENIKNSELKSVLYRLLSALHLEPPNTEIIGALREKGTSGLLGSNSNDFPESVLDGISALEDAAATSDEVLKGLGVEFTHLYRGIKKGVSPPPPYESVYKEGSVMGKSTVEVKNEYVRAGIELAKDFKGEPPDHLAFELEFMSFLCAKESEALEKNDLKLVEDLRKKQKGFLDAHLGAWLPEFCRNLREKTSSDFYAILSSITEDFVLHHRRILAKKSGDN
jgi:TorA maturation chaperone TorD